MSYKPMVILCHQEWANNAHRRKMNETAWNFFSEKMEKVWKENQNKKPGGEVMEKRLTEYMEKIQSEVFKLDKKIINLEDLIGEVRYELSDVKSSRVILAPKNDFDQKAAIKEIKEKLYDTIINSTEPCIAEINTFLDLIQY